MAVKGKKVSLFAGLIGEGLKVGLDIFMKLSQDEQRKALRSSLHNLRGALETVSLQTSSMKDVRLRERLQTILTELRHEIDEVEKIGEEDPLEGFFRAVFFPFFICFEFSSIVWGEFYDLLRGWFEPKKPVSYDEAVRNAERFFTLAGDFNVIATVFDLIGHIEILGTKLPANAVAFFIRNISWTFGIGWLTWVVMGPVLRWSIADPFEREMRYRVRPRDWTFAQLQDLYERDMVKQEYLSSNLAEMGYSDDKIDLLLDLTDRKIIEAEARKYSGEVEDNYVYGYADEQDLFNALAFSNLTKDEIMFLVWRARQRLINRLNDLRVKEVEKAYKAGRITREEASSRLSEFIKKPEMVERLLALWEQTRKPEEEVEPNERLWERKERLEIRLKGLNDQISFLQEYLRERQELYDVMIRELENRYASRIKRITETYDARIAAIREEFSKYKEKKLEEIETRLSAIEGELSRYVAVHLAAFKGSLEHISDATLSLAGYSRQTILNLWVNASFEELLTVLAQLAVYTTPEEYTHVDRMLRLIERYFDLAARYHLLSTIAKVRIEEREAKVEILVKRLEKEKNERIRQLESELVDRKEILEKKKHIEELRINARIAKLKSKADEISVELSSINRQLKIMAA